MADEPQYHPCHLCEKNGIKRDAVGCFSPDLDIKGLCFCDEHKENTMIMYMRILQDARESYKPNPTEA